jgi:nucleoside-diphosphate-sugar epimerase
MPGNTGITTFVTGATGLVGRELVSLLVARGHRVLGLANSFEAAERVRRAGAIAVMGDLLHAGRWQDEAASEWVFHLPPDSVPTRRITRRQADAIGCARLTMDAHLLDAVAAGATRRVVYGAHASWYAAAGTRPITEDELSRPSAWGRCFTPAVDRLGGYVLTGLPIITALPGWIYGNASWFRERVVEPVMTGRRLLHVDKRGPWVSPIHAHDCARALVHLAERGEAGGRYFLVNSDPVRLLDFAEVFARLANRPLRMYPGPAAATRLLAGPVVAEFLGTDAVFSNIRLRGIGFKFHYPTLEQGLQELLGALHE